MVDKEPLKDRDIPIMKSENTIEKEQETTVSRYLWSILYYTNALGSVTKRWKCAPAQRSLVNTRLKARRA